MSGEGMDGVVASAARDIEAQAAQWIERRDFGGWTDADAAELDRWLDQSLTHRVAFDRLDLGWQQADRLTALRFGTPFQRTPSVKARPKPFFRSLAVAAAGSAIAFAGWYATSAERFTTYATSIGGREIVRLSDGSQIELNTDTAIRIADREDRREVWLDHGEAFFQVVHDAAHPFTVNAGDRRLVDLGTKFSVRRESQNLRVAVSEGGVRLETGKGQQTSEPVVLTSGQIATATPFGFSVRRESGPRLKDELAWRNGVLVFHRTRMAAAVATFNRYNRSQIVVDDPVIANLEIGGTFPTTDVDGFAEVSRDVLHLRVVKDGNTIRISR